MSAFSLRKNNVGRAVVRFLIGAVIIAAIVIALNELVLKKKDNTLPDLSPQPSSVLIADQGHTDEPTVDSEPADGPADVQTGENAVIVACRTADIIVGPFGIATADAMMGEISPAMANAVASSPAFRVLIPMNLCNTYVAGVAKGSAAILEDAVAYVRQLAEGKR